MKKLKKIIKYAFIVLSVGIFFSYIWVVNPVLNTGPQHLAPQANPKNLKEHVIFLTQQNPPRNYLHPQSLKESADHIYRKCEDFQLQPERIHFKVMGIEHQNVLCYYQKNKKDTVIVGAHFDAAKHAPGADDNASGVAGLLELARLFTQKKPSISEKVVFAFYTLEEVSYFGAGLIGSRVHSKLIKQNNESVKMMISLEMIGYFSEEENSQAFPLDFLKYFYPTKGNFITIVGNLQGWSLVRNFKKAMLQSTELPIQSINAPSSLRGISFSDHASFWKFGFPAIMITDTAFYRNPHYHQKSDQIETLNFEKMSQVIQGVYGALTDNDTKNK